MNFNVKLEMDSLNEMLKKRGLEERGKVQKFIDREVIRLCGPYTPRCTEMLINDPLHSSDIGSGLIKYNSNYSHYLYYGKLYVSPTTGSSWAKQGERKVLTGTDLKYDGAPKRGSYWFERMKADHLRKLLKDVVEMAGGRT